MAFNLDILHPQYDYHITVYHVMTSYQWHYVTNIPSTTISETVTVIPISFARTAIFGLIPHSNIVSNGWRIYSSTSECQNRPVKVNTSELAVNTAKGISSPTPHGTSTRIWLLHLALWDAWRSCWTEAVNFADQAT